MKPIVKQIINTLVGLIVNAFLTMLATKIIDTIYNTFIKKPICFLCGSKGWRMKEGEKVRCTCRPERKWWKWKK